MRITIDNLDGRGALDYSDAVCAEAPVTIERTLNAPSRCVAEVVPGVSGLPLPARRGRVVVTSEQGTVLFTGYLASEPIQRYAGVGVSGPVYRAALNAISDEWLLDKQSAGANGSAVCTAVGVSGANLLAQLTQAAQNPVGSVSSTLAVATGGSARAVGAFAVQPAANWSTNAGAAANATYASYRVLDGTIALSPAGSVTHAVGDGDGSLSLSEMTLANVRELANDVTLSGAEEPAAYVQEVFQGDGTTAVFNLSEAAYQSAERTLLRDSFQEAGFDATQWMLRDAGGRFQLTSAGLTVEGGNGFDGQTTISAVNAVEMGGALIAELSGVTFSAASDGMLAGFYSGSAVLEDCFAGFRVRQSASTTGGNTIVVPVLNGAEVGTAFQPQPGHAYTMRLRLFCVEMQRVPQRYYCMVDGDVQGFGAVNGVTAPMQAVFELVDEGVSSNTPVTVLYDSVAMGAPLSNAPASATFVLANATSLFATIASVQMLNPGPLCVVSTLANGAQQTRLTGLPGQGVDCEVNYGSATGTHGKLTFFAGRVPAPDERINVFYRTERRSVARLADAASVAAENAAGAGVAVPGVSRWLGKVNEPAARSSADCEAAAQAVLAMSTARSASLRGSYVWMNPANDIWPGDVLQVHTGNTALALLIRSVQIVDGHALPELMRYKISFANDWATEWADGLGLKLSESIAHDAALPATAASGPSQVLTNLQELAVMSLTDSAIQVDAGLEAPAGGGFEVRRRDWAFGVGVDALDLVLRSPVRSFSIPRASQVERYYVRMYDGSTPPVYSRFSSAVYVNWPVAS